MTRFRFVRRRFASFLAVLLVAAAPASLPAQDSSMPAPVVDHHIHIQSQGVSTLLRKVQQQNPDMLKMFPEELYAVRSGGDALRQLDRAGIRQGVILSAGYMFASTFFPRDPAWTELMRAENRYNVEAAKASGGRLVAFVGINPFAANAFEELGYWSRQAGASGIKLHMTNSGFDLRSPDHIARLGSFFGMARVARMPIAVHSRGMGPFERADVRRFIDQVISQAGDLPVQIAHGGAYGGVDEATVGALEEYRDAFARKAPGTKNLVIELSAVAQLDLTEGKDPEGRKKLLARYVDVMRQIGMDRFVFGSDWPGISAPAEYFAAEKKALPITDAEWADIADNRAPYLLPAWTKRKAARPAR